MEVGPADAAAQTDRTAVAVAGESVAPQTEAGDVLTDPIHGKPCCWWRETVTEHWEERVRDHGADKDDARPDHRWEERSNELSQRTSGVPFLIEDGGGRIAVDLQRIDIDGDLLQEEKHRSRQAVGESIGDAIVDSLLSTGGGRRDQYTETKLETLAAGRRLLVSGRMVGGRIIADGECGLQVCEGTVADRLGHSRRSERRAQLGLVVGSAVAALGAVLAAAGAAA